MFIAALVRSEAGRGLVPAYKVSILSMTQDIMKGGKIIIFPRYHSAQYKSPGPGFRLELGVLPSVWPGRRD